MAAPSDVSVDLTGEPARYFGGALQLARAPLRMIDRLTGFWPEGGRAGKGRARGEKRIQPSEWFFRAHFYQDPVQPGSLGVEAIVQLAQLHVLHAGLAEGIANPRFEPLALGSPVTWKYRGQVVPTNARVEVEVDVLEVQRGAEGLTVVFEGALWVDGKRIYRVMKLGVRVVSDTRAPPEARDDEEVILDPAREPWMLDHAPTWTVPALPMTAMLDRLARAAEAALGAPVAAIEGAQVHRWLTLPGPTRTRTEVRRISPTEADVTLLAWREAATASLSRFEKVASARVTVGAGMPPPAPLAPLAEATVQPDPYAADELFQGPPFHRMRAWRLGREGASTTLDAAPTAVPVGALHPALLDASLHGIPGGRVDLLRGDRAVARSPAVPRPLAARLRPGAHVGRGALRDPLPRRGRGGALPRVPPPAHPRGARLAGVGDHHDRPPQGHDRHGAAGPSAAPSCAIGASSPACVSHSRTVPRPRSRASTVQEIAWLPGTVEAVYGTADVAQIAAREHLAHRLGVHPSTVSWDGAEASTTHEPVARYPLRVEAGESLRARHRRGAAAAGAGRHRRPGGGAGSGRARAPWRTSSSPWCAASWGARWWSIPWASPRCAASRCSTWPTTRRWWSRCSSSSSSARSATCPRSGSPRSSTRRAGLVTSRRRSRRGPARAIRSSSSTSTAATRPRSRGSSQRLAGRMLAERQSLLVHVEGTRSLACGQPVLKMSSVIIDMALHARAAIVPVRFAGGLPREPVSKRLDFPLGFGRQDHWIGAPLLPEALEAMPYGERRAAVVGAINATGPAVAAEQPNPGDPELARAVEAWVARTGAETAHAAILMALARERELQPAWQRVLEGMRLGRLVVEDTAEDRAVAGIARGLYGPRGPQIVVG